MHGTCSQRATPRLGRQPSAWATVIVLAASVLTSDRVDVLLLVMGGMTAAYTIGRWVEAQRAAHAAAGAEGIVAVLGDALVRCRRWERPLTLVRIDGPLDEATRASVDEAVRTTDEVCHEPEATYVVMPEESVIGATVWAHRLVENADLPTLGVAQFPVDGLTVDGLLAHAASAESVLPPALPASPPVGDAELAEDASADDVVESGPVVDDPWQHHRIGDDR